MSDITNLLALVENDRPAFAAPRRERDKWAKLYPAYAKLRANGYSCRASVERLIHHRAMKAEDFDRALNAFHILTTRRNKKKNREPQASQP